MKHNQNVLCVDILFEKKNYIKQFTAQERKAFQKYFGSNETNVHQQRWFREPRERKSLLIQILKVVHSDRKPFGSVFDEIATETGIFTVI